MYSEVSPSVVTISDKDFSVDELSFHGNDFKNKYLGAGFLVSPNKIITTSHIINSVDELFVLFTDGEVIRGSVNVRLESSDIAIIELEKEKENPVLARLGDSTSAEVGDEIFLIGAPHGLRSTLSVGHLTGKRRNTNYKNPFFLTKYIQTNAMVNSGNSGGPLFDNNGFVIGVVSHLTTSSGDFQGISFAIDIEIVKKMLLNKEKIWSNAQLYLVKRGDLIGEHMPQDYGLLVIDINSPSVYDKIGLKDGSIDKVIAGIDVTLGGDIILAFNDVAVEYTEKAFNKINSILNSYEEGVDLKLKIIRDGKIMYLKG
ncbi:S1C family serine protease [uncultured Croceitalea sp.]|uniref:S1C family serine protease n=1 Tax=uncultured Croceitalea sp. TaxID=1798908 RepID=UPI0033068255